MSKNDKSVVFFQIPKILHEDKNIKAQHIYIFMVLYDQLRQREYWNKTNEWISEQTKIGIRQVQVYLSELEKFGYLSRIGMGVNRKFSLGTKLNNHAIKACIDTQLNNHAESEPQSYPHHAESEPVLCGKGSGDHAVNRIHNKNLFKNIINNISLPSNPLKSTPKTKQEFPPLTADELNLIKKVDDGEEVTDLEKYRAKYLKKRHEKKMVN